MKRLTGKTYITVHMEGGLIQGIFSNNPDVHVDIIDTDDDYGWHMSDERQMNASIAMENRIERVKRADFEVPYKVHSLT